MSGEDKRSSALQITAYRHGNHWSLTEHCTGLGYVCDRIITKAEVQEIGSQNLAELNR